MPITVECEGCDKKYRVAEVKAGSVIRCKECGTKIPVPDEDDDDDYAERRPAKKKVGKRKKSSNGPVLLIIGLAAGGLLLVSGLAIGLMVMFSRGPQANPVAGPEGSAPATTPAGNSAPANPAVGGAAKWSVVVDPPKSTVTWPDQPPAIDGLRGSLDAMLISSATPAIAAAGTQLPQDVLRVFNLATGEVIGKFTTPRPEISGRELALRPDGTLIAVPSRFEANQPRKVEIWDVKQGAQVKTFPVTSTGGSLNWIDFGPAGELLAVELGNFSGKYETRLTSFDATSGKQLKQITLLGGLNQQIACFSPGRRYLAVPHSGQPLGIYDLSHGVLAGQIPNGEFGGTGASISGLQFSPDGSQLAILSTAPPMPAIYVFDVSTGERKSQVKFPADGIALSVRTTTSHTPGLQWLPDASGWLVCGDQLVDRSSGRVIWKVITEPNQYNLQNSRLRFPTPGGIWSVDGNDEEGKLTQIPSPWSAARKLLAEQTAESNLVRPGAPVSVKVDIGDLRFAEKDQTATSLQTAFEQRLKTDQLAPDEAPPLVLRIKYAETKGNTLQEFKQSFGPGAKPSTNPLGNATGRSIDSTKAELELAWTDADGKTVYWSHKHQVDPTSVFMKGELTAEGTRKQMFENLLTSIASLPMPYYLTADPKGPQLPLVHTLPRW